MINKYMKSNRGITLIPLIITIIVLLMIMGAAATGINVFDKAREQRITANMFLIQTKIKMISEQVAFSGNVGLYVGDKLAEDITNRAKIANGMLTLDQLDNEYIYILRKSHLEELGLSEIKLTDKDEVYLVNYNTNEVINNTNKRRLR